MTDTWRFSPDGKTALLTLCVGEIRNSLLLVHDGPSHPLVEEISVMDVCPCGGRSEVRSACWTGRRLVCLHCSEYPPSVYEFDQGKWTGRLFMEPQWLPLSSSASVAASSDGRLVAMTGDVLGVWNLETLRPLWARECSESPCRAAAFLPGSVTLATGSDTGEIALWAAHRGERVRVLEPMGHPTPVLALGYSPALGALVSFHQYGHLWTWDPTSGRGCAMFQAADDRLLTFSVSHDGRYAAFCTQIGGLIVWDLSRMRLTRVSSRMGRPFAPRVASFSPDSRRLLTQPGVRGTGALWDVRNGILLTDLPDLSLASRDCAWLREPLSTPPPTFSSDLAHIATLSADATHFTVYDTLQGRPMACVDAHPGPLAPDPPHHPRRQGAEWTDLGTPDAPVKTVVGFPGSSRLPRHLRRWEVPWRFVLSRATVKHIDGSMTPLAYSCDGSTGLFQVSRGEVQSIEAWDVETPRSLWSYPAPRKATAGALSPAHHLAAVGFEDGRVLLWSVPEGELVGDRRFSTHPHQLSLSADEKHLLVCQADGLLTLWRLGDDADLQVPRQIVWAAAFADTGMRFAALTSFFRPHVFPEDAVCSHYEVADGEVCPLATPEAVPPPSGTRRLDLWTMDWTMVPRADLGNWARRLLHLNPYPWDHPGYGDLNESSRFEDMDDWARTAIRRIDPDRRFGPREAWPDEIVRDWNDSEHRLVFTRGQPQQDAGSTFVSVWYPLSPASRASAGFLVCTGLPWASLLFGDSTEIWVSPRTAGEERLFEAACLEARERGLAFVPLHDPLWQEPFDDHKTLIDELIVTDWM